MENIKFKKIKKQLIKIITDKLNAQKSPPHDPHGFAIIDGFFNTPVQSSLTGTIIFGGPTVPMVGIVGNSTGLMYFFALKALMPNLDM